MPEWATNLKKDVVTDTHYRFKLHKRDWSEMVNLNSDNKETQTRCQENDVSPQGAIELVTNRCFLTPHPEAHPFIYNFYYDQPIDEK